VTCRATAAERQVHIVTANLTEPDNGQAASAADEAGPTLYDKIPYESRPYPRAHIDRLATVATLMGMTPAPLDACRVLEIGCAAGGHLIPMAVGLPGSRFVGIDLSARELADGQRMVAELGLNNIELLHMGVEAAGPSLGQFDYVVCHGVFSWVPPEARQGILEICRQNLSPSGVAYISYNTYPGWHFRDIVRHMMRFHARAQEHPLARARDGRRLLEFLGKAVPADKSAYGAVLKQEADLIGRVADWYLCHDHMADINEPFYFHQFAEQAAAKGLQYLGEAEFGAMLPRRLPADVVATLRQFSGDIIAQQQYLDFVRATPFRHSLLCHQAVKLNREPSPEYMERLHIAVQAKAQPANIEPRSPDSASFTGPGGTLTSNRPLMKAAMLQLIEHWPRTVAFPALCTAAAARVDPAPVRSAEQVRADKELLGGIILKGYYTSDLLELHAGPVDFCVKVNERPVASPLARLQAARQAIVTNLRHDAVSLSDIQRHVLKNLDGQHDRAGLVDVLAGLISQGSLVIQQDGQDPARATAALEQSVESALAELAKRAVLIA
jgi:methyltransferase-like protein/2-polyprenyl-3-methyl-5-hydroxy-6-metoxy-1,4-benzoquinol methylase